MAATLGTRGDLYPFLALAKALKSQGHHVGIASHKEYESDCRSIECDFLELGPSLSHLDRLWPQIDKNDSLKHIMQVLDLSLDFNLQQLKSYNFDVLINHPFNFMGPISAAIKNKIWISIALTPFGLFSAFEPPVLPQIPGFANPKQNKPWFYRPLMRFADFLHRPLAQPILKLYKQNNLPIPKKNPIVLGQFSPFATWALFDPEFAQAQPDWPQNTEVFGFPRWQMDSRDSETSNAKIVVGMGSSWSILEKIEIQNLITFLNEQKHSVLVVGGSKTEAIKELLPTDSHIQLVQEVNYSLVLKFADIFIHSGGIGAVAEGIFHNVWQVIFPLANDQFDNANRVVKLGLGQKFSRRMLNGQTLSIAPRPLPKLHLKKVEDSLNASPSFNSLIK